MVHGFANHSRTQKTPQHFRCLFFPAHQTQNTHATGTSFCPNVQLSMKWPDKGCDKMAVQASDSIIESYRD